MSGAAGPIPFDAIARYAELKGFSDPLVYDRFEFLIRDMDGAYLKVANKKPDSVPKNTTTKRSAGRIPSRRR